MPSRALAPPGKARLRLRGLAAVPAEQSDLLGGRTDETDPCTAEGTGAAIRHDQAVDIDGGSRTGEVEVHGDRGRRPHRQITRPAQGDPPGSDILGLPQVEPARDRVAYRAHDRNPPALSTVSWRTAALDMHEVMLGTHAPSRKFPCISLGKRLGVLNDEVGDLVHDGICQVACAAKQRTSVRLAFEPTPAFRAGDDLQQLGIEGHGPVIQRPRAAGDENGRNPISASYSVRLTWKGMGAPAAWLQSSATEVTEAPHGPRCR